MKIRSAILIGLITICFTNVSAYAYEGLRAEVNVEEPVTANQRAIVTVTLHNDSGRNFILYQSNGQIAPEDTIGVGVIEDARGPSYGNYGTFDVKAVRATVLPHSSSVIAVSPNVLIPQCGNFIVNVDFIVTAQSFAGFTDNDPAYSSHPQVQITLPVEASDFVKVSRNCGRNVEALELNSEKI